MSKFVYVGVFFSLLTVLSISSYGQTVTTVQDGPWDDVATWGGVPPDFNVGIINVNHNVTVNSPAYPIASPLVVDQVRVGATGALTVTGGAALQIKSGGGVDLLVNATGFLSVNAGAEFIIDNGVSFSSATTNTFFQAGSVVRTSSVNLPLASGLDGIDIYIQGVTGNLNLNATWNQLGANTNLYVDCPSLGANRTINFRGFITDLRKLEITNTNGSVGGRVAILSGAGTATLNVGSGGVNIQGDSQFYLATNGTVTLNVASDFIYNSSSTNASRNTNNGTGTINFTNGADFIMTNGLWSMAYTNNGKGFFNFNSAGSNMLVTGGILSENGGGTAQGTLAFDDVTGNQGLTWLPSAVGIGTINLTVAKASSSLSLSSDLAISALDLTSGTLITNGKNLSIAGAVSVGTGQINATTTIPTTTSLTITGAGTLPALSFTPGSVLANVSLNRTGASLSMTNASIANGGLVTLTAGSFAAPLTALGVYDILYNNTVNLITGNEIPISPTALRNLTKSVTNQSVTFATAPTINGNLTINTGSIIAGSNNVSVGGNVVNDGAFTQSTGATFSFLTNGAHSLSGTNSATFGALIINGNLSVSNNTSTLLGNLTINANSSLNATAGTFAFNGGPRLITNNGNAIQFSSLSIGTGASLTAPLNGTFSVAGDFSGNGTFVHNGSTVNFNGVTTLTGNNKVFNNITVAPTSSFSGAVNFSVLSNLVNNGTINFTGNTFSWNSVGTLSGSLTSTTVFNNITILAAKTLNVTLGADLSILNNLALTGNINHSTASNVTVGSNMTGNGNLTSIGTFTFTGLTATMSGTGAKAFKNLAVSGMLTVGNNVSYSLNGGTLNVTGTLTTNNGNGVVTINGNTSVISTGVSTTINNLQINGTLQAAGTINLLRNFTNDGTFNGGTGTIAFSGTAIQNIQGTSVSTFNNIAINNTSNFVNVQTNQNLKGILTMGPSALFDADGTASTSVFTLLSTSSIPVQDGAIAAIPGSATFNGNVTVQRYMQNGGMINRYISSPIVNMAISQLDFTILYNSIRYYDETVAGVIGKGYKDATLTNNFETGRGYLAWMYDAVDVTWDVTGAINQGSIPLPISYTTTGGGASADGWNLVGNPYPSGVVWNGPGWSRSNIDPVVSVTDLSGGTGYPNYYHTKNFNDNSGDLPNGFIAMGQAFWVHANAPGASLTITENAKNPAVGGDFYRKGSPSSEQLIISINNGKYQDRAFLKLNPDATEGYDQKFDGYKLKNEEMNVYLLDNEQRQLVMHTLSDIPMDMQIALGVEVMKAGEYEITFANVEEFSLGADLFLIDRFENKAVPVSSGKGYTISVNDISKPVTDRFYLSRNAVIAERKLADLISFFPNPVKDELTIRIPSTQTAQVALMDAQGKTLWGSVIKGEHKVDMRNYPSGMFILKVNAGGEVITKKIIKD